MGVAASRQLKITDHTNFCIKHTWLCDVNHAISVIAFFFVQLSFSEVCRCFFTQIRQQNSKELKNISKNVS